MNVKAEFVKQIESLMAAQDFLNAKYDCPEWRTKNHPWLDYVWVEAGELMEHEGSVFHYKKLAPNWPQVKLELVDILHFGLSHMIQTGMNPETAAHILTSTSDAGATNTIPHYCRQVASTALKGGFDLYMYGRLVNACGFTLQEIFDHYMNKYTLNRFRIEQGQVTGGYRKIWADGREDNEHLVELAPTAKDHDHLYQLLGERYAA